MFSPVQNHALVWKSRLGQTDEKVPFHSHRSDGVQAYHSTTPSSLHLIDSDQKIDEAEATLCITGTMVNRTGLKCGSMTSASANMSRRAAAAGELNGSRRRMHKGDKRTEMVNENGIGEETKKKGAKR